MTEENKDATEQVSSTDNGQEGTSETKDTETKESSSQSSDNDETKPEHKDTESTSQDKTDKSSETDGSTKEDGVRKKPPKSRAKGTRIVQVKRKTPTATVAASGVKTVDATKRKGRMAPVIRGRQKTHVKVSSKELEQKSESFGKRVMKRYFW